MLFVSTFARVTKTHNDQEREMEKENHDGKESEHDIQNPKQIRLWGCDFALK